MKMMSLFFGGTFIFFKVLHSEVKKSTIKALASVFTFHNSGHEAYCSFVSHEVYCSFVSHKDPLSLVTLKGAKVWLLG